MGSHILPLSPSPSPSRPPPSQHPKNTAYIPIWGGKSAWAGRRGVETDGGPCKRGSARTLDLAGSCSARDALTRASTQDLAGSSRNLQDPANLD
eukprot:1448724-Pyramimonas_sp.AAC.1